MRLYFPVDLTGNLIMIEKLVLGEIWIRTQTTAAVMS